MYAKKPFGSPVHVLDYLGRYTHRVALSNDRILSAHNGEVIFSYRDRKNQDRRKWMTLDAEEFIRRFLLHVIPKGFMRVRHYGFLANHSKDCLSKCRQLIGLTPAPPPAPQRSIEELKEEKTEGSLPQRLPGTIYVADFALDAENYAPEEGVRGALPGRLGKRLPRLLQKDNPAERARQIVETMADSLVQHLNGKGLKAQRLRNPAGDLPRDGWLVQGVFTELDEGNRLKRAGIGFGKGATSMDVQVGISDLASSVPRAAFMVFTTVKDPNRIPGAVVTMNPYVAAAKFVLQKNATERDIQRTAAQIVEEILKYEQQIKEKTARPSSE